MKMDIIKEISKSKTVRLSSYSGDMIALYELLKGCEGEGEFYYNRSKFIPVFRNREVGFKITPKPMYVENGVYHQKIWVIGEKYIFVSTGNINRRENQNCNNWAIIIEDKIIAEKIDLKWNAPLNL